MSYDLSQKEYVRLKGRLTKHLNLFSKARIEWQKSTRHTPADVEQMLKVCQGLKQEAEYGLAIFERLGSPDQWNNWERAKEDAETQIRFLPTARASAW